jgi:protein-disulfide isomerase
VKNRALLLGGVIAAALVVVVVAIVVSQGGSDDEDTTPAARTGTDSAPVNVDVSQNGIALGDPDAPVTMVEFVDMQCPFCAEYATGASPEVVQRFVASGQLKVELRVLAFLGPDSVTAARFAAAAAEQNKLFDFTELFFQNQGEENSGYVTEEFLRDIAGQIDGLDVEQAFADAETPAARAAIRDADRRAGDLGVEGTPTFYLQHGNGEPEVFEVSTLEADGFTSDLEAALQQ